MKHNLLRILFFVSVFVFQLNANAQQRNITGMIIDGNKEPIIGANVIVKGTTIGVITDISGKYSIFANSSDVLEVSFIGYDKLTEKVGKRNVINMVLKEDVNLLEDVVVVGYGTVKRANLSGAVATADEKVFQSKPSGTPVNALQGAIPGLVVQRSSGSRPGDDASFKIRDISSVNGGLPLVLIDGAEGNLASLNPNDIESVSVLKDAQASIYGNRAANGVLLVTTKSAKSGKMKIDFNAYYAFKTPTSVKKKVSLLQFAEMEREACSDGSGTPTYTESDLDLIRENSNKVIMGANLGYAKHFQNVDYVDAILGKSSGLQNYSLNLSGGTDRYNYYISGFYQKEDSPLKFGHDDSQRYALRVKNDVKILKNLTFHSNISYEAHDRDFSTASGSAIAWALRQNPWAPIKTPSGKFYSWQGYGNPAQELEEGGNTEYSNSTTTFNFALDWYIIPELKIVAQTILRKQMNNDFVTEACYDQYNWDDSVNRTIRGNGTDNATNAFSKLWYRNYNVYAEYSKIFAKKHDFKVMIGAQHEEFDKDEFSASRKGFSTDNFNLSLGGIKDQEAKGGGWAETLRSLYGRVSYIYNDRYIVEINGRYDGTSRFVSDNRWGLFTGYSAAWRLSEENFIKKLDIFDQLKLRGSWGQMGNSQGGFGRYDYISLINISSDWPYPFGKTDISQGASSSMASKARTWEKLEVTNIGLDVAVLNNRLSLNFDYFWKKNTNMLVSVEYPDILGATPPATNNGELKVNGWELAVGWRDKVKSFSYSVRANVSDSRNKVTNLGGFSGLNSGFISTIQGYPTNVYFGYKSGGIIKDTETLNEYKKIKAVPNNLKVGDMMYLDLDGDGAITPTGDPKRGYQGDLQCLGTSDPRYNFGVNIDMEWKGFDLGIFLQGVGKRKMIQDGQPLVPFLPTWHYPLEGFYHDTWSTGRPDAYYPILTFDEDRNNWNYRSSDHLLINAAYMRIKNITLGYTVPMEITRKAKIERLRVYFSGNDLWEVHNIPHNYDPEDGGSYAGYPFMRYFSFGLNLNF